MMPDAFFTTVFPPPPAHPRFTRPNIRPTRQGLPAGAPQTRDPPLVVREGLLWSLEVRTPRSSSPPLDQGQRAPEGPYSGTPIRDRKQNVGNFVCDGELRRRHKLTGPIGE
ncbi:unnamed protein product [Boreogadus saida]